MITVFPDPHPDELLYSVCARYKVWMQYPNKTTATHDFFGSEAGAAVIDLPNRLEHLVAALPPGHLYTIDEFIDNNTMFPFYSPFLSSARADLIRNEMSSNSGNLVRARVGLSTFNLTRPLYLRFCPVCVEEDRQNFSETYWHRIHQISGIELCVHHNVFLEASKAPFNNTRNPCDALSAEDAVYTKSARPLNLSHSSNEVWMKIAQNTAWLLKWRVEPLGGGTLRERYYNALLRQGFAYYNGRIRSDKLIGKFIEYYSQEALHLLGCSIKKTRHNNWLLGLLRTSKVGSFQHPLRHILLITFLGYTTKEFFTSFKEYKPFGDGPWPCFNHSVSHYRQMTIKECKVSDGQKSYRGPIGTFECPCGFIYTRTGPDKTEEDLFRVTSVRSYGATWETTLRELWLDTSITLRDASIILGVEELTVKRRAIYLGLPFPRNTPGSLRASGKVLDRYRIIRRPIQEERQKCRQGLLAIRSLNPNAGRRELGVIAWRPVTWLRNNDHEWFEANMPPSRKSPPQAMLVDWAKVDVELVSKVKAAALRLKTITDPPIRASLESILNEVGHRSHIQRQLGKLPITARTLDDHLESPKEFLLRKIIWAAELFRKEGVKPSRSHFTERAGTRKRLSANNELVQQAVDVALATLWHL